MSLEEMTSIWKAFSCLSDVQEVLACTETIEDIAEAIDLINIAKVNLKQVLSSNPNLLIDAMMQSIHQGVK